MRKTHNSYLYGEVEETEPVKKAVVRGWRRVRRVRFHGSQGRRRCLEGKGLQCREHSDKAGLDNVCSVALVRAVLVSFIVFRYIQTAPYCLHPKRAAFTAPLPCSVTGESQ